MLWFTQISPTCIHNNFILEHIIFVITFHVISIIPKNSLIYYFIRTILLLSQLIFGLSISTRLFTYKLFYKNIHSLL